MNATKKNQTNLKTITYICTKAMLVKIQTDCDMLRVLTRQQQGPAIYQSVPV